MRPTLDRRTFLAALGVGSVNLFLPTRVERAKEKSPTPGALLIAKNIEMPPFRDSVVLLFQHGKEGSGGLIVNKPNHQSLARIMAHMNIPFRDRAMFDRFAPSEVLYGGPVEQEHRLSLIYAPPGNRTSSWNLQTVEITPDGELLRELAAGEAKVDHLVACLGLSGWSSGQLEGEIASGSWQVVYPKPEALPGLLFDTPPCDRLDQARKLPEGLPAGTRKAI